MDKFYVYRPLLDLIGKTEGTDKGDGYNETLAYGAYTGGDVNLVGMTLKELDALQTKMLRHPKNKWKSSAAGRYQVVRTTARAIREKLPDVYPLDRLYDEECQDEMGCYLLGVRGIDKYLAGRLKEDTLINNLAQEWASFPTTADKGHYGGQHAAVKSAEVRRVLAEVRKRHREGQPTKIETVTVEKPVVPEKVEEEVQKKGRWWEKLFGLFAVGGPVGAWFSGLDGEAAVLWAGLAAAFLIAFVIFNRQVVAAIKHTREELAR